MKNMDSISFFCIDSNLSMDSYKEQLRDVVKNTFEEACNAISKNLPASLKANARLKIIAFFDADLATMMPYVSYWMEKDYDDDILEHELDTLDF